MPSLRSERVYLAHGQPRPSTRIRGSSATLPAPLGDCRGRPCGKALAGQPEGWPAIYCRPV